MTKFLLYHMFVEAGEHKHLYKILSQVYCTSRYPSLIDGSMRRETHPQWKNNNPSQPPLYHVAFPLRMLENVSLSQQRRNSFANSHLREVRSRKPVYFRTLKCDMSEVETAEATKGFLQSSLLKPQKIHLLNNPGNSLCSPLSTKCSLLSLGNSTHRSDPYCSSRISLG